MEIVIGQKGLMEKLWIIKLGYVIPLGADDTYGKCKRCPEYRDMVGTGCLWGELIED